MTQHASTAVKMAALALAAPALLLPMKAAGQQVATNTAGGSGYAACEQIKDPAKSAQCHWDAEGAELKARKEAALKRQREADIRAAAAELETKCWNEVATLRKDPSFGDKATEIARALVKASGRPAAEQNPCVLRDGVRDGLVRLKLLPQRVSLN